MYAPNNIILVVVGEVDTQDALAKILMVFGLGERRRLPALSPPQEAPQVGRCTAVAEADGQRAANAYLHHPTMVITAPTPR